MISEMSAMELADQAEKFADFLHTDECKSDWRHLAKVLRDQHAEIERLNAELSKWTTDPAYQYAGSGPINRKAIECRNEQIDDLMSQIKAIAEAASFPEGQGIGKKSERLIAFLEVHLEDNRKRKNRFDSAMGIELKRISAHLHAAMKHPDYEYVVVPAGDWSAGNSFGYERCLEANKFRIGTEEVWRRKKDQA